MTSSTAYYIANLAAYFLIYCTFTLGLNISFGMTGILDFAFVTFMATGAYFAGVTALGPSTPGSEIYYILGLNWPFPLDLLVGAAAAGLLGALVGLLAVRRLRSDYLAIVMVAVWTIAWNLVSNFSNLFDGTQGIVGVPQPLSTTFNTDPNSYVYVFIPLAAIVIAVLLVIGYCIERSPFGRALRAVRADPDVASTFGKPTFRLRLTSVIIACAYAGIGGALTIEFIGAMNTSGWAIIETVIVFTALLVGGRGNVFGAILGALLVRIVIIEGTGLLPQVPGHPELLGAFRNIAIGVVVILVIYFRPQGVLPERRRLYFEQPTREWKARKSISAIRK
ncbi:MAG TPA: branched-chain amino acid ABC transporter permease [Chloroflexota bacterium]|nr:branched-chain amino acid ABC transporter permease [Chloroflexota bacterium]